MHTIERFGSVFAVSALVALAVATTQDPPGKTDKGRASPVSKAPAQERTEDDVAAKMRAYATPGAAHAMLEPLAGTWEVEMQCFAPEAAGGPWTSKGTSTFAWVLDGHFLEERFDATWMGEPFHGLGHAGYDNLKKKYLLVWLDDRATGALSCEGDYDAASKTFTYVCAMPDVRAGRYARGRIVERIVDDAHFTMQMYGPGPDGSEVLVMQCDYRKP